jgi:hypothetical protein
MNLPNKLTTSRFLLTGAFCGRCFPGRPYNDTLALMFFSRGGHHGFSRRQIARDRAI